MAKRFQDRKKAEPGKKNGQGVRGRVFFFYFLSACLMFVLGVYVGRGTAPFRYDIPNIEKRVQELFTGLEEETLQKEEELGFYEQLKDQERKTSHRSPKVILARSSSEKKSLPENRTIAVSPAAADSKNVTIPIEKQAEPTTKPQSATKPPEKWTIQVAAFSSPEDAALRVKKFREKSFDAYVVEVHMDSGKVWYRLRVGKFTDRSAAAVVRERLIAEGAREAYILQDD